jgi:hypothetical protein
VLATIVGGEPSALSTSIATDVVVTFSEPIASIPSAGISLTGSGTLDNARFSFPYLGDNTKARVGITSTSVTGITFAGIIDVNESATASPSASITTSLEAQFVLDASRSSTLTLSGSNVTSWKTVAGATPIAHLNGATKPSLVANSLNGLPTVNFNNSNSGAGETNRWRYVQSFGTSYSLFAVCNIYPASGAYNGGVMVTADNFDHNLGDYQKSGSSTPSIKINTLDITGNSRITPIDLGAAPTGWFVVEMRVGGSDAFVRAAGSSKRALASWTAALDHLNVGGSPYTGHATSFSLAELRIYTGAVNDTAHTSIVDELKAKWFGAGTVLASPTSGLAYGSASNYAYGSGLVTDTGSWTWQFWANLPTGAGYAIGGHFAGIEWHDAANTDWYLEPGPGGDNMGYKLVIGASNRITYNGTKRMTLVRSGTNFTLYSNGVNVGAISIPVYTFTDNYRTSVGIYNASSVYPVGGRTWDHSIWDTARTAAQIAANDLSGRLHHYTLNGTLADSVGSLNLTAAGAVTYIAR